MADDLTPDQQAACDAYWSAKTHEEEHWAYVRMLRAGLPPSHGASPEEVARIINCPDCSPSPERVAVIEADLHPERASSKAITRWYATRVAELFAENEVLRANPWHRLTDDGIQSVVAIPGTELIATSDAEIVGIVIWKDRLICATKKGVFERGEDGKFCEIEFERAEPEVTEYEPVGKLLYPGKIAQAIYTDIVRWQAKNYGIAPPCWLVSVADFEALWLEMGFKEPPKDAWIAGIQIVTDPNNLLPKYAVTPQPLAGNFAIPKERSEDTEGPDHVLTQGEER